MRPPFSSLPRKNNFRRFAAPAIAWHGTCSLKEVSRIEAASAASHKRVTRRSSHANHLQSPDRRRRPRRCGDSLGAGTQQTRRRLADSRRRAAGARRVPGGAGRPESGGARTRAAGSAPEGRARRDRSPTRAARSGSGTRGRECAAGAAGRAGRSRGSEQDGEQGREAAQASRGDGQAACVHRAGAAGIESGGQRRDRGLRGGELGCRTDAAVGRNDFARKRPLRLCPWPTGPSSPPWRPSRRALRAPAPRSFSLEAFCSAWAASSPCWRAGVARTAFPSSITTCRRSPRARPS